MRTHALFLWALGILTGLCGCVKETETSGNGNAITFNAKPVTRAAVTDNNPMTSFAVWGGYEQAEGSMVPVFNETEVSKATGTWEYEGTRYWVMDRTYHFYAVHPSEVTGVKVTSDGNITITDFDASAKTGEEAIDLMTASATGISYTENQTPVPVPLSFEHLLARVEFIGLVEGGNATVTSIQLTGITTTASYNSANIPYWTEPKTGTISGRETNLSAEGISMFGDLLMLPQNLNSVKLNIIYNTDTQTGVTASFTLPTNVTEWQAGMSYKYTFTVTGGGYIIFNTPTVETWDEATGGNITIDVTEQQA